MSDKELITLFEIYSKRLAVAVRAAAKSGTKGALTLVRNLAGHRDWLLSMIERRRAERGNASCLPTEPVEHSQRLTWRAPETPASEEGPADVPGFPRPVDVSICRADGDNVWGKGRHAVVLNFTPELVVTCSRCPGGCSAEPTNETSPMGVGFFNCLNAMPPEDVYTFVFGPSTHRAER
jgi:hypothetical protein